MSFETLAEQLALVACVLLTFTLIGLPARVVLRIVGREGLTVPTPLLGIAVVVVGGWYWYGPFGGLRPMVELLVGVGVATAAVIAFRARHTWRRTLDDFVRSLALPAMVAVGVALVLIMSWGSILASPYPINVTDGNNDMASYALLGQHVAEQGPDDAGPIVRYDAGERSQSSFDFGAVAIVAASATGPFTDVWRYQHPLMAVALGLVAYVLARLLDDLAPGHTILAALAGVASICPVLITYIWSNYFLNEVLAISLVIAACVAIVHGAGRPTTRARVAHGLAGAAMLVPLFASYPHMAFAGPLVIVPALFAADGFANLRSRVVALVVQGAGALAVALILLPVPAWRIPDTLRYLGDVDAGWSLPGLLPTEILGFAGTVRIAHSGLVEWVPSILVLTGLAALAVGAIWWDRERTLGRFVIMTFTLTLVSYWYAYDSQGGPSYRQWKWISFFTPLLVAAALMLTAVALVSVLRRYTHHARSIAIAVGVLYCAVAVSNSAAFAFGLARPLSPAQRVSLDLSSLEYNPIVADIEELNVDLAPYWETMWAAYFLRDHEDLRLIQPSYYAKSAAVPGWTLQRRDVPVTPDALEVRLVNDTYQLVRR